MANMDIRGEQRAAMVERLTAATGPELAILVGWLTEPDTVAQLTDSDRLEVIAASARVDAWTTAMRARAVGALHDSVTEQVCDPADPDDRERQLADRQVAMELSLALGVSFTVAD